MLECDRQTDGQISA